MNDFDKHEPPSGYGRLRLLVAIACYGEKNLGFLKSIIRGYRSMAMDVDVVVVSNVPRDLGSDVRVVVGLPSKNPWSLPFAHKQIFAESADRYDLFAYSEDDIGVTETNIRAFIEATAHLAPNEIAGFLRYEVDESGKLRIPDAHGRFHWKQFIRRRGPYTIGEFSNEHAAFYLLTRDQLKRAIASGGFLRSPYEGRYDMLCTAATDPYTSCGFRKVVCISALDDFLIHHLSNRYAGVVGISLEALKEQVQTQMAIAEGTHDAAILCKVESGARYGAWSKSYYEVPTEELLNLVPTGAIDILSVGCGWGATEVTLKERGATVTALPLDSIIGEAAARLGIKVVHGTLAEAWSKLTGRKFECVVMTNLLHLFPNPGQILKQCSSYVSQGGTLVVSGPNFSSLRILGKRMMHRQAYVRLRGFEENGIHLLGPANLRRYLRGTGLRVSAVCWGSRASRRGLLGVFGRLNAPSWVLQARRR